MLLRQCPWRRIGYTRHCREVSGRIGYGLPESAMCLSFRISLLGEMTWTDGVDKILKPGLRTKLSGYCMQEASQRGHSTAPTVPPNQRNWHRAAGRRRSQPVALDMEQRTGGAALLINICSIRVMSLPRSPADRLGIDRWCTTVAPRTTAGHNLFFRIVVVAHNRHIHPMVVPFRLAQEDKKLCSVQ